MDSTEPDIATRRHALRARARAARRALGEEARAEAAQALRGHLLAMAELAGARRVAAYVATGSEIDPMPTLRALLARQVEIYLPHIDHALPGMHFAHWNGDPLRLKPNRFGILEPMVESRELLGADRMDVILLPLVAFDRRGHRLGSGAGYYDRALASRSNRPAPPLLVGVAHACQEVEAIPAEPWDIPMDAMATELGYFPITASMEN
jgi:5-formyltetrahydrofolate cyclo-ligase